MEKKEYAVSYYGGHVSAWLCVVLCVVVAIAGIMFMLLGLGGGTKSMMVALFFALVLGLLLAKDRKAYGEEMLTGLRESMFCVICVAFFMAGLLSALLKSCGLIEAIIWLDLAGGGTAYQHRVYPCGGVSGLCNHFHRLRNFHRYSDRRLRGDVSPGGRVGYQYGPDVRRGGQRLHFRR